jgi:hypothetical protein
MIIRVEGINPFKLTTCRSFADSGFCLVVNPSNSNGLISNCSGYTAEIRHDLLSQQTTGNAAFLNGDKIREESETTEGAERCPSR